jgi:hypothetical protein
MSYQIVFDGTASAELTHLLHAVQRQLNGHGIQMLGQMDAKAETVSAASAVQPCTKEPCPTTIVGHDPYLVVAGVVVGLAVGYALGKRSASANKKG